MALVPPLGFSPDEVRALLRPLRNDVSIALHGAGNPFNVGAIIRVAHSFLVREIIIVGGQTWYERASMGMEKFETVVQLDDDDALLAHVGDRPLWAVEKDHATIDLYDVEAFPKDVVLLFGGERAGIPPAVIARAEQVIGIPMYGVNHSYPLPVAVGIVLADWGRRRYARGTVLTGRAPSAG